MFFDRISYDLIYLILQSKKMQYDIKKAINGKGIYDIFSAPSHLRR